jgi:predicted nucleic acid-binding protein
MRNITLSADEYLIESARQKAWRFSWHDSLIITAALECGCHTLYSEDLQHQQKVETLTIINPFAS